MPEVKSVFSSQNEMEFQPWQELLTGVQKIEVDNKMGHVAFEYAKVDGTSPGS